MHCYSGHNKIHINGKPNTDRPLWPLTFGNCHNLHKGVSVLTETDYGNKMLWVPMHTLIDHWHQVLVTLSLTWTCMTSFVDSIMHVYWCPVMCDWFKRQCKRLIDWGSKEWFLNFFFYHSLLFAISHALLHVFCYIKYARLIEQIWIEDKDNKIIVWFSCLLCEHNKEIIQQCITLKMLFCILHILFKKKLPVCLTNRKRF